MKLHLQTLIHDIHDAAGYAKYIYENELTPEDAQWAEALCSESEAVHAAADSLQTN